MERQSLLARVVRIDRAAMPVEPVLEPVEQALSFLVGCRDPAEGDWQVC